VLDVDLILDQTDDVAKRLATKGADPAMVHRARTPSCVAASSGFSWTTRAR